MKGIIKNTSTKDSLLNKLIKHNNDKIDNKLGNLMNQKGNLFSGISKE